MISYKKYVTKYVYFKNQNCVLTAYFTIFISKNFTLLYNLVTWKLESHYLSISFINVNLLLLFIVYKNNIYCLLVRKYLLAEYSVLDFTDFKELLYYKSCLPKSLKVVITTNQSIDILESLWMFCNTYIPPIIYQKFPLYNKIHILVLQSY